MIAEQFITEHLDLWAEAVTTKSTGGRGSTGKVEFAGIQKLRELILELAVRGKLSDQRLTDGTSYQLLQQIDATVKRSGNSKQKKTKAIASTEQPYDIPSTWIWARLGMLGQIIGGGTPKSKEPTFWTNDGIKWLTPADLYGLTKKTIESGRRDITSEGLERSSARLLPEQSVLFSSRAPIGYVAINTVELATNQGFKSCVPHIDGITDYLYYFLKRSAKHIDAQASGTTFKEISGSKFAQWPVALPPLAEQHRIVRKVDELMALCDRLEQQTRDQHAAHETLVDALLNTLTQSKDANELAENWARLANHFDTLFTTEHSIERLEQAILQLAVRGKLVLQDHNEEPAAELLARVALEKKRLTKIGAIRKSKTPPEASVQHKTEVPEGWEPARMGTFISLVSGQHLKPEEYFNSLKDNSIPYLTGPAEFGELYPTPSRYTLEKRAIANAGDILITCKGSGVGNLNRTDKPIAISRQLMAVRPILADPDFVFLLLKSLRESIRENIVGIAIPGISREDITDTLVFLPPLGEQRRITRRVSELLEICDRIKDHLDHAGEIRHQMADAVVDQAIH